MRTFHLVMAIALGALSSIMLLEGNYVLAAVDFLLMIVNAWMFTDE